MNIWRSYLSLYRLEFRSIGLTIGLVILQSLLVIPITQLVRYGFDRSLPTGNVHELLSIGGGILVLNIASNIINLIARYLCLSITKRVIKKIRVRLINKLYLLPRSYYHHLDRGQLHTILVQDTERVDIMSNGLLCRFIPAILTSFGLGLILVWTNWQLCSILAIAVPPILLVRQSLGWRFRQSLSSFRSAMESYSSGILFMLQTIDLTRLQTAESIELTRQNRRIESLRVNSHSVAWWDTAYSLAQTTTVTTVQVLLLIVGGISVIHKSMTIGELLSFYVAAGLLAGYFNILLTYSPQAITGITALESLFKFIATPHPLPYQGTIEHNWKSSISFKKVSFNYENKSVITNFTIQIEAGKTIAIVGENGSGKSTLINLILGLYRPHGGEINLDNIPLTDIDIDHWRRQIGVVSQETLIFPGTIWENLNYGQEQIDANRVVAACKIATASEFIEKLPDGYQTDVGDRGMLLSGGQRQRLAIARALIRQPKLLILDEPTNHLDRQSIDRLRQNLEQMSDRPAIIIVTHDRRILDRVDRIYQLPALDLVKINP
jgi:ATP-binding cassette, subfamily B, bacterial